MGQTCPPLLFENKAYFGFRPSEWDPDLPNHSYSDPDPFSETRNEKTVNSFTQYDQKQTIEQ